MGDDRRGEARRRARSTSRCASPSPSTAGAGRGARSATRRTPSARSGRRRSIRRTRSSTPPAPPSPGPVIELLRERRSGGRRSTSSSSATATPRPSAGSSRRTRERLVAILFATEPFKAPQADFNVWALCPAGGGVGHLAAARRACTGASPSARSYDAFGSERYVLTFDNRALRDVASLAPYDVVEILVNGKTYGGGGIFDLYATVAADSRWAAVRVRPRVRPPLRRPRGRVLHLDVAYRPAARAARAVGAERDGAARSGEA